MSLIIIASLWAVSVLGCNKYGWEDKMEDLVQRASKRVDISSLDAKVQLAMESVDRACFVPSEYESEAYNDNPITIPSGIKATITAPHMHVKAMQELSAYINDGACVLDVGSGSGYLTTVFSELIGPNGIVMGIDYQSSLIEISKQNFEQWKGSECELRDNIHFETVNVYDFDINDYSYLTDKCPEGFDAIHVGATADEKILEKLEKIMKASSRLVIPIRNEENSQEWFYKIDKDKNEELGEKVKLLSVRYVPLVESDRDNNQHNGL